MAPGSGCQLNSGRVSEMASPKGPNRANPVLATGASEFGGARPRNSVASVGSCNCELATAGEGGAVRVSAAAGAAVAVREAGAGGATDAPDAAHATGEWRTDR